MSTDNDDSLACVGTGMRPPMEGLPRRWYVAEVHYGTCLSDLLSRKQAESWAEKQGHIIITSTGGN